MSHELPPLSRRRLLQLGGLTGAAGLLAACAGPGGDAPAPAVDAGFDGPVEGEVSFAHWRAEDKEVFGGIIADFVRKNPKVTVRQDISPSNDYQSTALQKLRGGTVGDAFAAFRGAQFTDIAKAGVWSDLSATDLLSRYDARLISPGNAAGKQLGLPYQLVFNMPLSNVDLLADAGYADPPKDWDGFLAMCEALKGKGVVPMAWPGGDAANAGQLINVMVVNNAPSDDAFSKIESGALKVTDDWFLTTLRQYAQLRPYVQSGATGTSNEAAQQLFVTRKAALLATGSFQAAALRKLGVSFGMGLLAPITTTADKARYEGVFNATFIVGVNAKSNKRAAALAWLRHLSDPAVAATYANGTAQHVTVSGVEYTNPDLKAFAPWLTRRDGAGAALPVRQPRHPGRGGERRRAGRRRYGAGAGRGGGPARDRSEAVTSPAVAADRQRTDAPPVPPRRRRRRTSRTLYLFAVPALIVYGAFFVLPAVQGLRYAVTDWDGFSPTFRDVGMANLTDVVTADDLFRNALGNNLKFMLVVVIGQTALSLLLAVLLAARSRGSTLLRGLFFLPTILSSVSVAFVWRFVYDPTFGLANTVLGAVGVDARPAYLGNAGTAIYWVAISQIWFHAGQMMVVYIAGINQIPGELYDAARADGAGRWQQFRFVTWPMVAPATALVMAYTTIQSFKAFDLILGLAGNPPRAALDILSTRIYTTFANSQLGYAAAESIVFMLVIALITWLQNRAAKLAHG